MQVNIPEKVRVVHLESAPFKRAKDADIWTREHGIVGVMSDADTGHKGEISISTTSIEKMLCGQALRKSVTPAIHYAALVRVRDIIRESFVAEIHPDYRKINGVRSVVNGVNAAVKIAVLYGCVSYGDIPYRAKTTLKLHQDVKQPTKAYTYEISNIEVLTGIARIEILPNVNTSMNTCILLNGVVDVNGMPLMAK